jgi:hypothetical protein
MQGSSVACSSGDGAAQCRHRTTRLDQHGLIRIGSPRCGVELELASWAGRGDAKRDRQQRKQANARPRKLDR